jgi:hypothetical protein
MVLLDGLDLPLGRQELSHVIWRYIRVHQLGLLAAAAARFSSQLPDGCGQKEHSASGSQLVL